MSNGTTEIVGEPEEEKREAALPEIQQEPVVLDERFVQDFEAGVVAFRRWITACLKSTQPQHWINHGTVGEPKLALQAPGAEALCGPLGISYAEPPKRTVVDYTESDGSKWYAVEVEGWLESKFLKRRGYYFAAATSLDKFFTAKHGFDPLRDRADVINKALSHWLASAVSRLAGLRNPDPRLLLEAGIPLEKIARPGYGERKTFEAGADLINEGQTKLVWARAKGQNIAEGTLKAKLKALGAVDEKGEPTTKAIKKRDLDALLKWIEGGGQMPPPETEREPGAEG